MEQDWQADPLELSTPPSRGGARIQELVQGPGLTAEWGPGITPQPARRRSAALGRSLARGSLSDDPWSPARPSPPSCRAFYRNASGRTSPAEECQRGDSARGES